MTYLIIFITALTSILAFEKQEMFNQLKFNPYQIYHRKEWYRLLTHGFLHADYTHLIINMIVFYSFGQNVENIFRFLEEIGKISNYRIYFLTLYLGAIVFSTVTTLAKHKNHHWYNAVGASGAVSAITFTSIFFDPFGKISLYFIVPIPGFLFGIAYLAYSYYMSRQQSDNINHDAHFIGAVFGILFPLLIDPTLFNFFAR